MRRSEKLGRRPVDSTNPDGGAVAQRQPRVAIGPPFPLDLLRRAVLAELDPRPFGVAREGPYAAIDARQILPSKTVVLE
jgi:hypothetical protein